MNIQPVAYDQLEDLFLLYDEYNRPQDQHPSLDEAKDTLEQIRQQSGEVFVACTHKPVGTYMIHICKNLTRSGRPYAVVENVICSSSVRRTGIGRALMEHAIDYAKSAGCYKVMLQTGENRTENHRFYESCGFTGGKRTYQVRF